jgi:hypothetical protein
MKTYWLNGRELSNGHELPFLIYKDTVDELMGKCVHEDGVAKRINDDLVQIIKLQINGMIIEEREEKEGTKS